MNVQCIYCEQWFDSLLLKCPHCNVCTENDPNLMEEGTLGEYIKAADYYALQAKLDAVAMRIDKLEFAVRYWSGYNDVDFAIERAEKRSEGGPKNV